MRRLFLLAASIGLSGCSSMPSMDLPSFNFFSPPPPPPVTVQLDSLPAGADAVTSIGPGCKTPCSVSVPPTENFSVTFTLDKHTPQTVPVQMIAAPVLDEQGNRAANAGQMIVEPSPVFVQLEPVRPVRRAPVRKRRTTAAAPKRPPAAAPVRRPAAPPPPASSAFPPPPASNSSPFPPPR